MPIYDAAMEYAKHSIPLVVLAGKEYGTGSSRVWAAKGTKLLGIRAIIAESFERIHRSNLIGMGVIPFEFTEGQNRINLSIKGDEKISILGINQIAPNKIIECIISRKDFLKKIKLKCRIDTIKELEYFKAGGILQFVLNSIIAKAS